MRHTKETRIIEIDFKSKKIIRATTVKNTAVSSPQKQSPNKRLDSSAKSGGGLSTPACFSKRGS